ncbi:hypothetical protein [Paenibacillus terrae]|uniref:Uncharacterized protein n=1 Tax=Paenibacillus terrae TaxID=159743 RepID=A0A0D7WTY5_9BACL|nr:hypothetical protein [Paenibacillus terrae]KJD42625.1 hypothetical protein QD47_27115 [Paenibacillus terrae]
MYKSKNVISAKRNEVIEISIENEIVFSTKVYWEDIEASLQEYAERDLSWSLYSRLPRFLKQKICDENQHHISKGLEFGLMHDWGVVLRTAISDTDLFNALTDAAVIGCIDGDIEILGKIDEVDMQNAQLFIYPDDPHIDPQFFRYDQVKFPSDVPLVDPEDYLTFDEAWRQYELKKQITSIVTGRIYHIENDEVLISPQEIRGDWRVTEPPVSKEKYIDFLMSADDHINSLFTGKSLNEVRVRESEGTLGDLVSLVYDQKSDKELFHFLNEWK